MKDIWERIKRMLWLFSSADLTLTEALTIGINKGLDFIFRIIYSLKSFLSIGELNTIYGYKKYLPRNINRPKYALISYFRYPLFKEFHLGNLKYHFSNNGTVISLAKSLNELGYIVDVVDLFNNSFKARSEYDLVITPVYDNFKAVRTHISKNTVFIYFPVVAHRNFVNEALKKRFQDFKERNGIDLPKEGLDYFSRTFEITKSEDEYTAKADGIIVIGDQQTKSFSSFPEVHTIFNGTYFDEKFKKDLSKTNLEKNKNNFLFFGGGRDNIRKGLDLAVEAVLGTNIQLYICSEIHPVLLKKYNLENQPNIHILGYLKQRSQKFYNIINMCDFVIQPSCAEGIPGGVLDCMQYGLIPIVSKECNISEDGCAIVLENTNLESVTGAVKMASNMSVEELFARANKGVFLAKTKYSPETFVADIKKSIERIVAKKIIK